MADDTTDTRPGDAPGVLKTGPNGELPEDLGGRRAWVWMQDSEEGGGGRFDVLSHRVDMWIRKGAKPVPNYPLHFGPSGRLARPRVSLGGGAPAGGPTVGDGTPAVEGEPPADPTLALPASALGAVEPAADEQPNTAPADGVDQVDAGQPDTAAAPAEAEQTDQTAGDTAAAKTTTRKAGRTR